jgi:hypothetical protein
MTSAIVDEEHRDAALGNHPRLHSGSCYRNI